MVVYRVERRRASKPAPVVVDNWDGQKLNIIRPVDCESRKLRIMKEESKRMIEKERAIILSEKEAEKRSTFSYAIYNIIDGIENIFVVAFTKFKNVTTKITLYDIIRIGLVLAFLTFIADVEYFM